MKELSFVIEYASASYPAIKEFRMELGEPSKYQTVSVVEKITPQSETNVPLIALNEVEIDKKEYEIIFRIVDNSTSKVTSHSMSREELNNYITVLKTILSQAK